jgi:hypothetical protein
MEVRVRLSEMELFQGPIPDIDASPGVVLGAAPKTREELQSQVNILEEFLARSVLAFLPLVPALVQYARELPTPEELLAHCRPADGKDEKFSSWLRWKSMLKGEYRQNSPLIRGEALMEEGKDAVNFFLQLHGFVNYLRHIHMVQECVAKGVALEWK